MIEEPQGGIPGPRAAKQPALTVIIQSWWTPALALIMLVVGLLGGYFGRPLLDKSTGTAGEVAVTTPVATVPSGQAAIPTSTVDPAEIMAVLVSKTYHFKGDPNAKITMIEFSDYQ